MSGLQGKVVIVTGGSGGLGAATAACLARDGANVVVTGRDSDEGEKAAAEVGAVYLRHDVTSEDDWRAVVEATVDRYGRLDGLVNNAGIDTWSLIEHETLERFEQVLKVNLTGIFLGTRIPKGAKTTNWAARRLTTQQILYAATDAWACRELYLRFKQLNLV